MITRLMVLVFIMVALGGCQNPGREHPMVIGEPSRGDMAANVAEEDWGR
jgi:hypothetical protein